MADGRCGGRVVLPLGTLSLLETVAVLSGRRTAAKFFDNLGRSWIYERDV